MYLNAGFSCMRDLQIHSCKNSRYEKLCLDFKKDVALKSIYF